MTAFDPTPEQAAAIEAPLTPELLVAGAGAGKTTVMAHRILHVVHSGQARADQILALTFTNKAARHLEERVREVLGPDADATVATYHSFGASLVADHALALDLAPGTRVLNRAESWQLLFAVFDEFRFDRRSTLSPELVLTDALNLASRAADHLVPVEAIVADCHEVQSAARWKKMSDTAASRLELCQVVAAYGRRKRARNLLDFDDQVGLAVKLVTEHPEVADGLRLRHPVVLLDEYQDTNFAQRRLLQLIYPAGSAITAVGDDMQSIYGFRGAHLANILSFPEHFPPVTARPLQTTFRFGPSLGLLANRIQAQVEHSLPKALRSGPDAPETTIECFLAADDAAEAAAIADDIARRGPKWSDSAVLCRKRRLIAPIVDALQARGVPVEAVGTSGLLDRPEIVDLVAWLEILADPSASVALLRILTGPRYRIGLRDLAALARHGRDLAPGSQLIDALCDLDESGWGAGDVSSEAQDRLHRFDVERRALGKLAARLPVVDLAEAILARTDLWPAAGSLGRENLLRLLDLAARFKPVEGDPGLAAFVEYLHLLDDADEDLAEAHLSDTDAVRVMTIHQAKGLEFPSVYVPGLAGRGSSKIFPDGRPGENAVSNSSALPWWLREDDEGIPSWRTARMVDIDDAIRRRKLDEEWRLLYVAC
ncbi:MAG: ATP-dependent helicase UvrD/PcrA, partial [Actinomycetota bacterium]|nr:ATP-dependent helicase UvrD/PcrA [Actinomycetota bacterium]